MKQSKIRVNLDGLEEIKRKVGNTYRTRVGILGSNANRAADSGINNATLGVIQMFGSVSRNIPPRDFLTMPIEHNKRDLIRGLGSGAMRDAFNRGDYKRMFELLGVKAEEFVQMAFETGGFGRWAPNAPSTIARKGSSAPLIDTGQLRRAITSDVVTQAGSTATASQQSAGDV